jgi:mycothiol synthase
MTSISSHIFIRPRRQEDDERCIDIYHQWETVFKMTLASWRFFLDKLVRPDGMKPQMFVAEHDGVIVGQSILEHDTWSSDAGAYFATIEVDRDKGRQGIGSALWADLEPRLKSEGATKAYTRTITDIEPSERFAAKHGFERTGRAERVSRLVVAEANLDGGYDGIEEKLADQGIVIKTVAELDTGDDSFMRELHEAISDGAQDIPSTEEYKPTPYETWQENFMKQPTKSPHAYWVALEDGRPVGIANFDLPGEGRAWNGLTSVRRSARGKGIARGLKKRSITWARDNGILAIDTGNDASNARMLDINVRLGYKPLPAREEWVKKL